MIKHLQKMFAPDRINEQCGTHHNKATYMRFSHRIGRRRQNAALTLIELLVVIGIWDIVDGTSKTLMVREMTGGEPGSNKGWNWGHFNCKSAAYGISSLGTIPANTTPFPTTMWAAATSSWLTAASVSVLRTSID